MKKRNELDTQGCLHLLEAMVKEASRDYLNAPEDSKVHKDAESFFKSQYFTNLTGYDGRIILRKLDKQREESKQRKKRKEGKKNV